MGKPFPALHFNVSVYYVLHAEFSLKYFSENFFELCRRLFSQQVEWVVVDV